MQLQATLRTISCLAISSLAAALIAVPAVAQAPIDYPSAYGFPLTVDRGSSALWQSLQKLHTRASLILVVAHPDDEDGGMLAYETRDQGVYSSLLTLNRGEGGQNVMSNDYWDQLGEVRTQELLGATNAFGVHLYFTRVADFGFSKSLEEALKTWGHDKVLYDVVRTIRQTRPLVITAVFAGNVSDGHGQHQTSGVMAQEAFTAAADPNVFPDQIKAGLLPWAPFKVYARVPQARVTKQGIFDYATSQWQPARFRNYVTNTWIEGVPSTTVSIRESNYNPLIGRSYLTLAREGLAEQKSQNGGIAIPAFRNFSTPYHLYATRATSAVPEHENSFFDGIDISLAAIASYAPAAQQETWRARLNQLNSTVESASAAFDSSHPDKIAPQLAEGLTQTNTLLKDIAASDLSADAKYNMTHELLIKQQQFNDALGQSLSLTLVSTVAPPAPRQSNGFQRDNFGTPTSQTVVPGQTFNVDVHVSDMGTVPVEFNSTKLISHAGEGWTFTSPNPAPSTIAAGETVDQTIAATVPANAQITRPYFTRPNLEQSYYDINIPEDLSLPTTPYPLTAEATYTFHGVQARITGVVQTYHRYTGPGPLPEPLLVAPSISVTISPDAGVIPLTNTSLHVQVTVHSSVKGPAKGTVHLQLPKDWHSKPESAPFAIASDGDEEVLSFEVMPAAIKAQPYNITAIADYNGQQYKEGFITTGYPGLRPYPYYREATYRTSGVDLKIAPHLKVGYINGTGDDVAQSLQDMGIHATFLSAQDISSGNLSSYDAIIIGIRAYTSRPELKTSNNRLLDYVKNGGNLIVQYQAGEYDHNYTPYTTALGPDIQIVVEEDGPAEILAPSDPVLSWPNKITSADFNNWVEERGHGFMTSWDSNFVAPIAMHDSGQEPQNGGLIYAKYGKGTYTYLAFAFFRELPEGVPGSFRIMANLLSIGKNPNLHPAPAKQSASLAK